MTKFQHGEKVRIKDNPTKMRGIAAYNKLTPGAVVTVDRCEPDPDGDIMVRLSDENDSWAYYIHEDCVELVETDPQDVRVGDRIRAYNKFTEVTIEGVVRKIELRDDHKWLWIGKGCDIAADLNTPEDYDIYVLERAFKWPDHEGFIRITGGPNAGQRGLARLASDPDQILIDTDDGSTLYKDTVAGQGFDFEYVEG